MSTGNWAFKFPSVSPLLLERRPDAFTSVGVAKFGDYVALAVKNRVVKAWRMDQDDGMVSLYTPGPVGLAVPTQSSKLSKDGTDTVSPPPVSLKGGGVDPRFADLVETGFVSPHTLGPVGPVVPTQSSKLSEDGTDAVSPSPVSLKGGGVDPRFVDLVETLGELWKQGDKQPLLAHAGSELLKVGWRRTTTLNACGVGSFKAYAKLAKDAGIVEIYGPAGKQTMALDPTIRVRAGYT